MEMIVHHAISVNVAILTLFFILQTIVDAFHVEVFKVGVFQIVFAIMAPPVKVHICCFWPELERSFYPHGETVKQEECLPENAESVGRLEDW